MTSITQDKNNSISAQILTDFKQITKQYALFHICFLSLSILELAAFVLFFSFLTKTTIFAFSLAGLFLTGFAYFVLFFYFQAKKPEELLAIRERFLSLCQTSLPSGISPVEDHAFFIHSLEDLVLSLHRQEYTYYSLPSSFITLCPLMQKFSAWVHWKDIHHMKELILFQLVSEHIELIKLQPTDLNTHAQLAQTYEALAELYTHPHLLHPESKTLWVSPEYFSPLILEKRTTFLQKALEEYTILNAYRPSDPWVYTQLGSLYNHLDLPEKEISCYETLLKITPENQEILFQLGILYFKQGHNAQGLQLYEKLKKAEETKAAELIKFYERNFSFEMSNTPPS